MGSEERVLEDKWSVMEERSLVDEWSVVDE
jgi:hypothetical protein